MCWHVNVRVKLSFMYFQYTSCCPLLNVFKKMCANFGCCDMHTFCKEIFTDARGVLYTLVLHDLNAMYTVADGTFCHPFVQPSCTSIQKIYCIHLLRYM
uniref:Putative secreted protein n=1 Tax=Amblyomma cajennense TaxID=34607 RepID=A0A023FBW8_AMBCJ